MSKNWREFSNVFALKTSTPSVKFNKDSIENGTHHKNSQSLSSTNYLPDTQRVVSIQDMKPNEEFEKYKRKLNEKVRYQRKKIKEHDKNLRIKRSELITVSLFFHSFTIFWLKFHNL